MLDVSNNNGFLIGHPEYWRKFYRVGQRRVFLKGTEGSTFRDLDFHSFRDAALAAGFKVGQYHFARPSASSVEAEISNALGALPVQKRGRDLRFCIDVEDSRIHPGRNVGQWVEDFCAKFRSHEGYLPVVYGSFSYLSSCRLRRSKVGPLWLAWYTRDGKFHHTEAVPHPWETETALQFSPRFSYPFMPAGSVVDMSHLFDGKAFELPRFRWSKKRV